MNYALYFSAFMLGLLGSVHCAGMCGPIALMLPQHPDSSKGAVAGRLIYNAGRVVTYVIIGLFFGMLGLAVAMRGFQRELSVLTGVIILLVVLLAAGKKKRVQVYGMAASYANPLRKKLRQLFSRPSTGSLFFIGLINGLLPCGFVYLAVAGATATGSLTGGVLYMALFGLGTFPIMMTISFAAGFIGLKFRRVFSKLSPFIAVALALFLIYRGTDMKTDECCKAEKISAVQAGK